ncbi:hypothetical protein VKT23_018252 [Stygiomarasmius scandens]|uniref:Uncharacterized protein n=1 Tax=Marasmiellus scandens TaxID=2682957 RepID=A0ABR1ITZ7_9AGAR
MGGCAMDVTKQMRVHDANGGKGMLQGQLNQVPIDCSSAKTLVQLFVGTHVPFNLLLGHPWQHGNFVSIDEHEDGTYLLFKWRNQEGELLVQYKILVEQELAPLEWATDITNYVQAANQVHTKGLSKSFFLNSKELPLFESLATTLPSELSSPVDAEKSDAENFAKDLVKSVADTASNFLMPHMIHAIYVYVMSPVQRHSKSVVLVHPTVQQVQENDPEIFPQQKTMVKWTNFQFLISVYLLLTYLAVLLSENFVMVAPTHTLQSCAKHCSSVTGLSEAIDEAFNVANHQILMGSAESPFNILLRSDGGIALSNKRVDVTELELHSHDEPMLLEGQDSEPGEDFNSDEDEENQKLFDPEEALARVRASFFINGIITHSDRIMKPQEVDHYAKTLQLPLQSFGYNFIYSILSQMHVIHQVMQSHEEYTVSHMDDLCPDASPKTHYRYYALGLLNE